jgi:ATP-binding cassette, subfamily F, member 3
MHSCELLIEALNKYEGSYLLVSHDRYFISKTANKIWEIDNHKIREFKGSYEEWVDWKERNALRQEALATAAQLAALAPDPTPAPKAPTATKSPAPPPSASPAKPTAPINKETKKELQRQQRLFQELEEKIAVLTRRKDELEASLADPSTYSDKNKFVAAETEYKKKSEELDKVSRQYEQVFEKIVELEKSV